MNNTIKFITITALLTSLFNGCAITQQQYKINANNKSLLKNKKTVVESDKLKETRKRLLKNNADFQNKNKNEAMIVNNSDSRDSYIPSFQEPIFTKIVIFPYKDKNDIYYEKQVVWKEIRNGHIVLKVNNKPSNKFGSILNK